MKKHRIGSKSLLLVSLILIAVSSLVFFSFSGIEYSEPKIEKQKLVEDFRLLRSVLEEAHPALYRFSSKKIMDNLFDDAGSKITDMSVREFCSIIAPSISAIKCGHTGCAPSEMNFVGDFVRHGKCFPFGVKILADKLFIVGNYSADSTIQPGFEVKSINSIPATQVLAKMLDLVPSDGNNVTRKYREIEGTFWGYYYIGFGAADSFNISGNNPGDQHTVSSKVAAITVSERSARKNAKGVKQTPVAGLSMTDNATAILSLRSFDTRQLNSVLGDYEKWVDSTFLQIKEQRVKNLIIDLRGNSGGRSMNAAYLFGHIAQTDFNMFMRADFNTDKRLSYFYDDTCKEFYGFVPGPKGKYILTDKLVEVGVQHRDKNNYRGKVFVLVNGGTFSSGAQFAVLTRYYNRGTIIGEEAGGDYVCNASCSNLLLPNSHIQVRIARGTWTLDLPGYTYNGRGILPDHPIPETIDNTLQGKDAVLEYTFSLIKGK
jgi:hypothetical protein